jgi:uncharacterized protein YjaZ
MDTTFTKPKKIKKYDSLDTLMASFFGCKEANVAEYEIGGSNYMITYSEFKKSVEDQGIWGYVKDKTIHVWFKSNISIEALVTFLAHETGHLNGKQYKDVDKDENKAVLFEQVAAYAFSKALKILEGVS